VAAENTGRRGEGLGQKPANNLFLGENSAPAIFAINTYTNYSSSDYNGFRPNAGAPYSFAWNSPPWATAAD
jgi:hypothetical protein